MPADAESAQRRRPRRGRALAGLLAALALAALVLTGLARVRLDASASALLPAGDRELAVWRDVQRSFGADPIVVLLASDQPRALLDAAHLPALVGLEGRLAALDDVAVVHGPGTALNQIADRMQELALEAAARRDALRLRGTPEAEAEAASLERRYGSLFVLGFEAGPPTLRNPSFAGAVVFDQAGRSRPAFRWLVPDQRHAVILVRPRDGLDQLAADRLVSGIRRTVAQTPLPQGEVLVTGAPVLSAALAAQVRRELPLLAAAALLAVAACFAWLHPGRGWRRLEPLALALAAAAGVLAACGWLGLPVSLSVLALGPIALGVCSDIPIHVAHGGRRRTVLAIALAGVAGFAGLVASPLPFVRDLGIALAASVLLVTAFAVRGWGGGGDSAAATPRSPGPKAGPRAGAAVVGLAVTVAVAGWGVLGRLPVEARPDRLARGLPALADAEAAERVIGASGELVIRLEGDEALTPETLRWFAAVDELVAVRFGDRLRPVLSPAQLLGWLGDQPTPELISAAVDVLPGYLTAAVVRSDRRQAIAAYGLRLGGLDRQAATLAELRAALPPPPAGVEAAVTGLPAAAARSYALLARGRWGQNLGGLLLAALCLLVLLRDRRHALAAAGAAALAVGWGLALLWAAGIPLTPLTVPLGSLTAAVGSEFTALAAERVTAGAARPWASVNLAALSSAAGFAVLALSRLSVLAQFGLVLCGSVGLAYLAARLVVPLAARRATAEPPRPDAEPAPKAAEVRA